jgi:hypothetical protein
VRVEQNKPEKRGKMEEVEEEEEEWREGQDEEDDGAATKNRSSSWNPSSRTSNLLL